MIPIVDTRSYELVRDRIAEILANELPNQVTLHNTATPGSGNDLNATVFINRIAPLSNESMPMINVWMGNGDYDNFTQLKQDGTYIYNVDIYTSSPSTSIGSGDVLSMSKLQKLAGVVQGILMHPSYVTLGFERPFIEHREVRSIATGVPNNNLDAHSVTQARLELVVRVPEHSTTHTPSDIAGYDTQVKIGLTDKGYIYSGDNIPIPEPVCDPVTIEQSDGTLIFSAPSGSTYQVADSVVSNSDDTYVENVKATDSLDLPDITHTDSNGSSVVTPAQTPFVCTPITPCADATVSNSNDSYSTTVASGGNLELPNIDFTDSDGTTTSVPSMENLVCTPQVKDLFTFLNYKDTNDIIEVLGDNNNAGTYTTIDSGLEVSIDGVNYTPLIAPYTVVSGTQYYFKRTTATVTETKTLQGTYV